MTRNTSIEAYHQIQDSGVLSKMRWTVYDDMFHNGPSTSNESQQRTGLTRRDNSSRCSELRDRGFLEEVEVRVCTVSGHKCIVWDVTDRRAPLEVDKKKKKTTKQQLEEAQARIKELEDLASSAVDALLCLGCRLNGSVKVIPRGPLVAARNSVEEDKRKVIGCAECGFRMTFAKPKSARERKFNNPDR